MKAFRSAEFQFSIFLLSAFCPYHSTWILHFTLPPYMQQWNGRCFSELWESIQFWVHGLTLHVRWNVYRSSSLRYGFSVNIMGVVCHVTHLPHRVRHTVSESQSLSLAYQMHNIYVQYVQVRINEWIKHLPLVLCYALAICVRHSVSKACAIRCRLKFETRLFKIALLPAI